VCVCVCEREREREKERERDRETVIGCKVFLWWCNLILLMVVSHVF
jgi:hypothetical protein